LVACAAAWTALADEPSESVKATRRAEAAEVAKALPAPVPRKVDFAKDVQPILAANCFRCHGEKKQESGLRLHIKTAAMQGGDNGAVIRPRDLNSPLLKRVGGVGDDERMPPPDEGDKLSDENLAILRTWIEQGADWPDSEAGATGAKHWAYQRPVRPRLPEVKRGDWSRTAIDRFILARLEKESLSPSGEVDRARLLRRVSLDLVGLPPTTEVVAAFAADASPDAFERAVDRLLAAPAFGEKWAAMWLDLARYADTQGYEKDNRRTIWRYRDWVIDAFNHNMPFDEFTIEQLAGDLLPHATSDQILATAFHRNTMTNTEGGTDNEEFRTAAVIDRVNTTWSIWMATTFGCTQCHSHKYDPFTHREYYQFFAFFNQTQDADNDDESPTTPMATPLQLAQRAQLQQQLADVQRQLAAPNPQLEAEAAQWAEALRGPVEWKPTAIRSTHADSGATLTVQGDNSILASGARPDTDVYRIVANCNAAAPITAIRLEALPDASLAAGGSGRADDGNFVLSRFKLSHTLGDAKQQAAARTGRFVRIELPGDGRLLSLAEVEIFVGGKNAAREGLASQSSTDFDGPAQLAIDGNTNGDYEAAKSTTHTRGEKNPWWEVDLKSDRAVERIAVWNRTDNNLQARLAGCRVLLLDRERRMVWETTLAAAPSPSTAVEVGGGAAIALAGATADFSQNGFEIAYALSGNIKKQGWAVQPQVKSAHAAVFALATPEPAGAPLEFTLEQRYERPNFTLGRFRISVTSDPRAVEKSNLPVAVHEGLSVAAADRTPAQQRTIVDHYRQQAAATKLLVAQADQLNKQIAAIDPPRIPIMRELPKAKARQTHIFIRGSFLNPGDPVEPGMPAALHKFAPSGPRDRLAAARWIVSPENPLTGRVLANRLWERLFGTGIVETTEDFGAQGARPSHPELLDWLAVEAVDRQWNLKSLLRAMVTSAVYRQSAQISPELLKKDAFNRLLARGPRVRLSAEQVRDQALAVAGLLSRKIGGPSVMPPQPDGVWQVVYSGDQWITPSSEDRYRRGLYTFWRRTAPYPSMAAFDAPSREYCVLRRTKSNTPLQALVTLNDPVYIEAAQALARKVIRDGGGDAASRAAFAIRACLARQGTAQEVARIAAAFEAERAHYAADAKAALAAAGISEKDAAAAGVNVAEAAAWAVVASGLMNVDEFVTRG
jgi:hypothetical protein